MPKDTATSGIRAVADKSVGMQFFIVFTIICIIDVLLTAVCYLTLPLPLPPDLVSIQIF